MNTFYNDERKISKIKSSFPRGTVIVLSHISDPYAKLKPGSRGTVQFVDDYGQIHVLWESGLELALIDELDKFKKEP